MNTYAVQFTDGSQQYHSFKDTPRIGECIVISGQGPLLVTDIWHYAAGSKLSVIVVKPK
jgi:hypothetical protein